MTGHCEYAPTGDRDGPRAEYRCRLCGHKRWSAHPAHLLHRNCPKAPKSNGRKIRRSGGCHESKEKMIAEIDRLMALPETPLLNATIDRLIERLLCR